MTALELVLLAVGLSMDACAVAMSNGMCHGELKRGRIFAIGAYFGLMQGLMPLLGYFLGGLVSDIITTFDHYIALIILGFIGAKMIYEAFHGEESTENEPFTTRLLLLQGIATSMDEFAVGISLAALPNVSVIVACVLIGATAYALSIAGYMLGKRFGTRLSGKAQVVGGLILVGVGLKIFIEHMWFS